MNENTQQVANTCSQPNLSGNFDLFELWEVSLYGASTQQLSYGINKAYS